MSPVEDEIRRLHEVFCELTDQQGFSLNFGRDRAWFDWMRCGWGEADLRLVIRWVRIGQGQGKRNPGALKFSNLIGDREKFEEDLMEARRELNARPRKPALVQTVQALPGGGERRVEVLRDQSVDAVDVSGAFAALREQLGGSKL